MVNEGEKLGFQTGILLQEKVNKLLSPSFCGSQSVLSRRSPALATKEAIHPVLKSCNVKLAVVYLYVNFSISRMDAVVFTTLREVSLNHQNDIGRKQE